MISDHIKQIFKMELVCLRNTFQCKKLTSKVEKNSEGEIFGYTMTNFCRVKWYWRIQLLHFNVEN